MKRRLDDYFILAVAVGVAIFGLSLGAYLPNRTAVVGWNVAWSGFDVGLAALLVATWLAARRAKWWAVALAGAVNAFQLVDIWFSLTVFYSLKERPGMAIWAVLIQPLFALLVWRHVLKRVGITSRPQDPAGGVAEQDG